jgi:membrane protease YdiL (CAAX protease family)
VDVDDAVPPVVEESAPVADGWAATRTQTSLLPAALLGIAILLAWRFVGVRFMREGEVQSEWLPLLLGGMLPMVFILGYPVWIIRRAQGRVFNGWPGWRSVLLEGVIALGVLFGVQSINMLLAAVYVLINGRGPGIPTQFEDLAASDSLATLLVMAVMACVWAPVAEELFFRRFVLRAFAGRFPLFVAIVLQAFVFAVLHDYGGLHLGAIFVLGLAMGGLYAWRKTILTSMILHMLQNTMAMAFLGAFMLFSRVAPTLGVYGESQDDGFRVTGVAEQSAAADAGLQAGDLITHVEGTPVHDSITLRMMYWLAGLDGKAGLKVHRGGETLTIDVVPQAAQSNEDSIP